MRMVQDWKLIALFSLLLLSAVAGAYKGAYDSAHVNLEKEPEVMIRVSELIHSVEKDLETMKRTSELIDLSKKELEIMARTSELAHNAVMNFAIVMKEAQKEEEQKISDK